MTIVFFLPVILRDSHRRIFAMDELIQEGNRIIILDATDYYKIYRRTATDSFLIERTVECKTKSDFIKFKNSLIDEPVIFVSDNLHMKMCYEIFKILVRKQDKLLVSSTRFTPAHYKYPEGLGKILTIIINSSDKFFPLHLFRPYYSKYRKIFVPDYYLGATEFLTPMNIKLSVRRKNRIFVHADDINFAFEPMKDIIEPKKKIGVFLDQMLPYFNGRNPDLYNEDVNREYKKTYYRNLVATLKQFKQKLNLDEVIIALHPEAKNIREKIDMKFHPFKTYLGKTHELIKDSTIVFGHFSTSLNIAAFYKKPILLLLDNEILNRKDRSGFINSYSEELQLSKINIDNQIHCVSENSFEIDNQLYDQFIKKFLKEIPYQGNATFYAINKVKEEIANCSK